MEIILYHFGDVDLKNQGKKIYDKIIEALIGVKNYDAHDNQIKELYAKISCRIDEDRKIRTCVHRGKNALKE